MRILMLADLLPDVATADSPVTLPTLRLLANEHRVSLLAFAAEGAAHRSEHDGEDGQDELRRLCQQVEFIPVRRSPWRAATALAMSMAQGGSYLVRRAASERMSAAVRRLLRDERIDAIHLDDLSLAQFVPGYWQRPIILDARRSLWREVARRAHADQQPVRRWMWQREAQALRSLEAVVCRRATVTIASSEMERAALEQALGAPWRIHIVPESVDLSRFEPIWLLRAPEPGRLLTLAPCADGATQRALTQFLTGVYTALHRLHPLITLDLLTHALSPWYACSQPGLSVAAPEEADDLLWRRAAVYLAPPLPHHQAQRGILGALAAGIPVVAHPATCDGLAVLSGEHLLMAQTSQDFADCIEWLSREVSHMHKLVMRGRRLIQERYDASVAQVGLSAAYAHVAAEVDRINGKPGAAGLIGPAGGSRCVFCS